MEKKSLAKVARLYHVALARRELRRRGLIKAWETILETAAKVNLEGGRGDILLERLAVLLYGTACCFPPTWLDVKPGWVFVDGEFLTDLDSGAISVDVEPGTEIEIVDSSGTVFSRSFDEFRVVRLETGIPPR